MPCALQAYAAASKATANCSKATRDRFSGLRNILPDPPKHAGRIDKCEIANAPGAVFRWTCLDIVFGRDSLGLDVTPPSVHVRDEQMHHEVVGVLLNVEILKQERAIPVMQIGQIFARPREFEAHVLVKLPGKLKVSRRHKGLDLYCFQLAHDQASVKSPLIGTLAAPCDNNWPVAWTARREPASRYREFSLICCRIRNGPAPDWVRDPDTVKSARAVCS